MGFWRLELLKSVGISPDKIISTDINEKPKKDEKPLDYVLRIALEKNKAVKKNSADIGFGFDGDGDRCGVIDNEGNEIFSDKIGLIIARNLSPKYKGSKFVVDVKSTGL